MVIDWPLVGREDELAFALDLLDDDASSGIILAGLAGVGKSRLAAELFAALRASGRRVITCAATGSTASIPFGAVVDLLPDLDTSVSNQLGVLRAVAASLAPADGAARVVVGLDDAHLADEATAALIHHLGTRHLVTLVATVRSGEVVPDAVTALWKDGHCRRLDVQALARPEVEQLLTSVLGGPTERNTDDRVWRLSAGNPLLVRELVVQALDDGTLHQHQGFWRWLGDVQAGDRLVDIVRSGIGRLSDTERNALALLAYGEPLGVSALTEMADPASVQRLVDRAVIRLEIDGKRHNASLAHPLYGEVIRAETSSAKAAEVMRALAEDLERRGRRRSGDAGRLGRWAIEAGLAIDREVLEIAAVEAYLASDFKVAEQLARADPDWPRHRTGYVLGAALGTIAGRDQECYDVLTEASIDPPDDEYRTRIAYFRIECLFQRLGRPNDAAAVFAKALTTIEDPAWRDLLTVAWAPNLVFLGDREQAMSLLEPMINSTVARTRLAAVRGLGYLLIPAGVTARMLALCDELLPHAFELQNDWEYGLTDVVSAQVMSYFMEGRLDDAEALLALAETMVDADRQTDAYGFINLGLARLALLRGRPLTATERLRQALAGFNHLEWGVRGSWGFRLLAEARSLLGDVAGAEEALAGAAKSDTALRIPFASDAFRAAAWVAVAASELDRARAELVAEAAIAHDAGQFGYEALVLHDAARLGAAAEVAPRLAELAGVVDGLATQLYASHAAALASDDAEALDDVSQKFAAAGFALVGAEAATHAALAFTRDGLRSRAAAAQARATNLLAECEGASTPALATAPDVVTLTRREREVATLAARGQSSKEIAETLHVSARTVDNHLQHAYEKLGVRRREELPAVLGLKNE